MLRRLQLPVARMRTSSRLAAVKCCCIALAVVASSAMGADPAPPPPGVMLKHGEWRGDVGSYDVPKAFESLPAARWPLDGWTSLAIDDQAATMTLRALSTEEAGAAFKPILAHRRIVEAHEPFDLGDQAAESALRYVRVPGGRWQAGVVPLHRFKNGSSTLVPELGHRFALTLGDVPYAFTLQNGLRTADGRPYGEGTQFLLEIGGQRYRYDLGGYGWAVTIKALGDFDGDGKPDFLFLIGGPNTSSEALVLSSQARPGRNPPTTYLTANGC